MKTTQFTTQQHATDGEPSPRPALERLRTQVRRAAEEIARLDAENRALRRRVRELEQRPQVGEGKAFVTLDDPEALRTQIEGFVSTIDAYLSDQEPSSDASDQ